MQLTISKTTAKAVRNVIGIIGGVATTTKNKDGTVNMEQCKADLKKMGITPKQFHGLAKLADQIETKMNTKSNKKK